MPQPEAWLRGPIDDLYLVLLPAAHALIQADEDIARAAADLTPSELWVRPGGAASAGFHLRHMAGAIDRLLVYADGAQLSEAQRAAILSEADPGDPPADAAALLREAHAAIDRALVAIRTLPRGSVFEPRAVGRAGLPSSVFGILSHLAEHTARHTGQLITTVKIVRGLGLTAD